MNAIYMRALTTLIIVAVVTILVYDSKRHFDRGLIKVKRDNNSSQTNWNLFYGQRFVFYDGPFRYGSDFEHINRLIQPGHVILSDLATSYYAAANLPTYVRNVHRHQGRWQSQGWQRMLDRGIACNLHQTGLLLEFEKFFLADRQQSDTYSQPKFKYVLVNKDSYNRNVRSDCLWNRRALFMQNIVRISELKFEGEYLNLYEINDSLSSTTSQGN